MKYFPPSSSISRVFQYLHQIPWIYTHLNFGAKTTITTSITSHHPQFHDVVLKTWHFIYPNNFVKLWGFQSIIVKWFDKDDASGILDICEISRLNCYILFKVKESLRSFWAGANFLSFNASSFPIVLPLLNKGCHTAMMLIPY